MKDLEQTYHQLLLLKTFQYRDVELSFFSIFLLVWHAMAVEAVGKRGEEHSGGGQGDSGEEHRTQDGMKVQN